ncbi:MAG: TIGR03087 family PEP-CTERM/XrtA system glycosyltransferase [Porticoccaceae bacterium]
MKPALLFLSHRIPFPPNKGDKIRSYHLLRYLSEHYRVFLGTFIDDPEDWQYQERVRELCEDCCFVALDSRSAKWKSLRGFLSGEALTLPYFYNEALSGWVDDQLREQQIEGAVIYSSAMAQYVMGSVHRLSRKVIDFVDIDSDKWRQYSDRKPWPLSWIYRREADRLLAFERQVAADSSGALFVSFAEADLFKVLAPEVAEKTGFYNNGVDVEYFSPAVPMENPYSDDERALVFTGAMDYWPNVDAVCWFAREAFPLLRMVDNRLRFYIVGSNPSAAVLRLGNIPGVVVTGRVADVRPYLKYAMAAVAPMRVARGIQNKVLEAMAMAKTTIVSPQALEGIAADHANHVLLAEQEADWLTLIKRVMDGEFGELGHSARQKVMLDFCWNDNLPVVKRYLEGGYTT